MKTFIKYNSVCFGAILVASCLFLGSCDRDDIIRYLKPPAWMEVNEVSSKRLDLRWESVAEAKQYVVYKVFDYEERHVFDKIGYYASQYEVTRTVSPEYKYEGSYNPKENGYRDGYYEKYYCYFAVRVVDEKGNMSEPRVVRVSRDY